MADYLRQHKLLQLGAAIAAVLIFTLVWLFGIRTPAYTVYIDGKEKLVVKDPDTVKTTLDRLEKQEEAKFKKDLELCTKFDFKRTFARRSTLAAGIDLDRELKKEVDFKTNAAVIEVNGKPIAYLDSKNQAEQLLNDLKDENARLEEGEKLVSISFDEKVVVKERQVKASQVMSLKEAYNLITIGTDNPEKYVVAEGDSLWLIARRNDMYVDDIVNANRLETDNLKPGDELILVKSKPYINVLAQVEGEKTEEIPYETKVVVDRNSASSVRIKQAGQNGEKHIVYVATKRNGSVDKREIREEKILKEAVDRILVKGTKVQVASRGKGSGTLDWPAYGPISNYYRGGHPAIDIAARMGAPIKAVDGGYVTSAGYQGGYGYCILIDHGNGIVTRYAHCSKLYVSAGQSVSRGATIGAVGSTGRSTGPHLHFEVIVNGAKHNPLNYLR